MSHWSISFPQNLGWGGEYITEIDNTIVEEFGLPNETNTYIFKGDSFPTANVTVRFYELVDLLEIEGNTRLGWQIYPTMG